MQPLAYLIISNLPGENRLKNLKYFLGLGDNVLGVDARCQIVLPSKYDMLNFALNIRIGNNFITIQALHPHLVYVQANFLKHLTKENNIDNYFPLAQNIQYVPRIGQFFYVGRIKAVIGCSSKQELARMKNIVNHESFKFQNFQFQHASAISGVIQQKEASGTQQKIDQKQQQTAIKYSRALQADQCVTLEEELFLPKQQKRKQDQTVNKYIKPLLQPQNYKINTRPCQQISQKQIERLSQKSRTQKLDEQDYQLDPTLVVEDGMYGNEPTINLEQTIFVNKFEAIKNETIKIHFLADQSLKNEKSDGFQKKSNVFSQQVLMNEIRMQSQKREITDKQIDFSMPDTIVDKQFQQHPAFQIKQTEIELKRMEKKVQNPLQDQDDMPPTIQEESPSQKIKPCKTLFEKPKIQQYPLKLYQSDQVSMNKRLEQKQEDEKDIESFDDLFGFDQKPEQLKQTNSLPVQSPQVDKPNVIITNVASQGIQEPLSSSKRLTRSNNKKNKMNALASESTSRKKKGKQQQQKKHHEQIKIQNVVNLAGFKPAPAHRDFLKKQGYQIVANPHHDYGILLVKQPLRLCNKLLLALVDGKRIENQQWIFNKQSQIQSKLNGMNWKQIYQKKGVHGQLLKGKGRFFISKQLQELLNGVVERMGGELVTELIDKKRVLNIVLKVEDSQDTQLYLKNRQNKKWRFLKSEILIDCVFSGRYSLEQKYIIKLFKDEQ